MSRPFAIWSSLAEGFEQKTQNYVQERFCRLSGCSFGLQQSFRSFTNLEMIQRIYQKRSGYFWKNWSKEEKELSEKEAALKVQQRGELSVQKALAEEKQRGTEG